MALFRITLDYSIESVGILVDVSFTAPENTPDLELEELARTYAEQNINRTINPYISEIVLLESEDN
jgi:hypothetical protein